MPIMRARIQNGRWVLDDPTDLPEGTVVEIVTRPAAPTAPEEIYLDDKLRTYIRTLLEAAGSPKYSAAHGFATPKDEEEVASGAKSFAHRASRRFVTPQDIQQSAADLLRRFVVVPSAASARGVRVDDVVRAILDETPVP